MSRQNVSTTLSCTLFLGFLIAFVFACGSWSFYICSKLLTGYEEALRPLGLFLSSDVAYRFAKEIVTPFPLFWINCVARAPP